MKTIVKPKDEGLYERGTALLKLQHILEIGFRFNK